LKKLLLICFITLLAIEVEGQSKVDSLQRLINKEENDIKKVELLNALSFWFFDSDIAKANITTQQALDLAKEIGDQRGMGWAIAYRGVYNFLNGFPSEAQSQFEQSLSIGNSLKEINLQTYSLTQLGNTFRDRGVFDSAKYFYDKAGIISLKSKDSYYQAVIKKNLCRYFLVVKKPDSALVAAQAALKLTKPLKDSILLADVWILIGHCYRAKDDFTEAERYYQKTKSIAEYDDIVKADFLQGMGEIFFRKGDFKQTLQNWQEVLTYYRKNQYKYGLAELLLRMGTVFEEQGYYDLANEYLSQALQIAEKASYNYLIGEISHGQSWVYFRAKTFELALKSNQRAIEKFKSIHAELDLAGSWDLRGLVERNLKNYDSSLYYHKKSLEVRIRFNNKVDISASLFNLGGYYLITKDYERALTQYFGSLKIDKAIGDNYGISLNYNRIGEIYTKLSRLDSAKIYLEKSIELSIPVSANEIFRDNYLAMASYFEKLDKPGEAIKYYKKYTQFTDSLYNKQIAQSLAAYRTLYDVERNEQKITLLSKDNELQKARVQQQQVILYSVIGGSLILLVLLISYYQFYKRLKKLNLSLAGQNELIQAQSEELMMSNETLSKLNREISEQKEEIQAQAEELAESNQTISEVNEQLEQRIETRTAELKQAFKELDTFFYRSSHDFRRPLTTFMGLAEVARVLVKDPAALELFEKVNENALNLDKMLRKLQSISDVGAQELIYREVFLKDIFELELANLKSELDRKGIRTTLAVQLEYPFYSYAALIKIIVQNLLENAITFNTTVNPVVHIKAHNSVQEVIIEIQDNGLGIESEYVDRVFEMYFRANDHSKGNGLGLYIVKKTVQKLRGRIELESLVGVGTTVRIFLPHKI
jgi:signal transduction histidine kinase